jgi:hypothetical protein
MTVSGLDAELVVPATQVLGEVTWAAEASETRVTSSGRAASVFQGLDAGARYALRTTPMTLFLLPSSRGR